MNNISEENLLSMWRGESGLGSKMGKKVDFLNVDAVFFNLCALLSAKDT